MFETNGRPLRILLIQYEQTRWRAGRSYPYSLNYGIKDALRSHQVEVTVIASPWLAHIHKLCRGKKFDQVWLNDLPHFGDLKTVLDDAAALAPVCIGFITESIEYTPTEIAENPSLGRRRAQIDRYLEMVTHVAVVDEVDRDRLQASLQKPVLWIPNAIPANFVNEAAQPFPDKRAFFSGVIYGDRDEWINHARLKEVMGYQQSTNSGTLQTVLFDTLPGHRLQRAVVKPLFPARQVYPTYLAAVSYLHKKGSKSWLQGMQAGSAVVNLPHYIKAYSTRVTEGMAAGRPVISWRVPDRPANQSLFVDGEEILLFSTPDELVTQIERVQSDPEFSEDLVQKARLKINRWHTTEKRVEQILHWVVSGVAPTYGINQAA